MSTGEELTVAYDTDPPSLDCDGNAIPDDCQLQNGNSFDCQLNGILDECDLASGDSLDTNFNGQPDECESCASNADCDDAVGCSFDRCITIVDELDIELERAIPVVVLQPGMYEEIPHPCYRPRVQIDVPLNAAQ